jgi:hypothetical protein
VGLTCIAPRIAPRVAPRVAPRIALAAGLILGGLAGQACSTTEPPRGEPAAAHIPLAAPALDPAATSPPAPIAAGSPVGAPPCGDDAGVCTMHAWMKANVDVAIRVRDCRALTLSLERLAALAPPGYANWASIASDGADAARVEDVDAVKASCRGCHAQYADRYKKELHDRKI